MIVNEKKEHNRHNMVDSYKIMENGFERKKKTVESLKALLNAGNMRSMAMT